MADRYREVMRRKDNPHVYFPASPAMRARTDVLEPAFLDTQTNRIVDTIPSPPPNPPAAPSLPKRKRKPAAKKKPASGDLSRASDDLSLESLLGDV